MAKEPHLSKMFNIQPTTVYIIAFFSVFKCSIFPLTAKCVSYVWLLDIRKRLICCPQIFNCSMRNVAALTLLLIGKKSLYKFGHLMNCCCSFNDVTG